MVCSLIGRGLDPARFHVILHVFRHAHQQETETGAAALRLHRRFFPFARACILHPDIGVRLK